MERFTASQGTALISRETPATTISQRGANPAEGTKPFSPHSKQ